jgi:hypothetical protein
VHFLPYISAHSLRSDVFSYHCVPNAKCRLHVTRKNHYWLSECLSIETGTRRSFPQLSEGGEDPTIKSASQSATNLPAVAKLLWWGRGIYNLTAWNGHFNCSVIIESKLHVKLWAAGPVLSILQVFCTSAKFSTALSATLCLFCFTSLGLWFSHFPCFQNFIHFVYHFLCNHGLGRAMAQAVSRRPPTAETRVRFRVSPCGICDGQSGTGTGFSP